MHSCIFISSITLVKSRDVVTLRLCLFLLALLLATVQSAVVNGQARKPVAAPAASSTALLHPDSLKEPQQRKDPKQPKHLQACS